LIGVGQTNANPAGLAAGLHPNFDRLPVIGAGDLIVAGCSIFSRTAPAPIELIRPGLPFAGYAIKGS
jgi:hypothetical protein